MSTLTDRYVHAATRFVQDTKEREELSLELRERIDDTVAALATDDVDPQAAERQALTDLGDPLRLSAEYRQRPMHLIGPRYFYVWLRVMLVSACTAAPVVAVISTLATASTGAELGDVIGNGIGSLVSVAVHAVFWVTLFFAVAERVTPQVTGTAWTPDLLPQLPTGHGTSKRVDLIASLVALTIIVVVLVWQQLGSPFIGAEGRIPMINPELGILWLVIALVLVAAVAVHTVWVYRHGWTRSVAIGYAVLNLAFAAAIVPLLLQHRLLNPELIDHLGWTGRTEVGDTVAAAVIGAITLWELVAGFVRASRHRRTQGSR